MTCGCSKGLKLKIKKGESLGFAFGLTIEDSPIDLTGGTITFQVRQNLADNGVYVINKTITTSSDVETIGRITDAEKGQFVIMVTSTETAGLSTLKPYFAAIYYNVNGISRCISADDNSVAQLIILNP